MVLKKNSKVYISIIVILIAIFVIFSLDNSIKQYGNDKESIEKVISSIEGYENDSIEILEIKDIYDMRVVGFLSNNNPAYIQFFKNQKGNYEWRHIEKSVNQSFASYLIQESNNEAKLLKFMIVTNQANVISKMQLGINEQVIQQEFNINQKSVTWINLPESKGDTYTFKYKYYDKDGKLIADN
ncbi:hypothetical protein RB620_19680 [Paenibacillus sp. LHD-117]|uniref:hypothetical protein n=1 Tax=Paenibacillus sp. LHD-117 TaxID=3071412 RepID=UPI0027DEB230|nr:hypothetical protein [Paenibacillus sp. LHD-117]MDQ6421650.1 hypothetical protein [Paenibacillus sp. LHD-117]